MTLDTKISDSHSIGFNSQKNGDENLPEQLNLGLESADVLETIKETTDFQTGILAGNIVGDTCPNCQLEVGVFGICTGCGYCMNNNYNNDTNTQHNEEKLRQELLNYIDNLDGIFEDVDIESIQFNLLEVGGKSRNRTMFKSKGMTFEILSLGKTAVYYVEGVEFYLKEIPNKSNIFYDLRGKMNISSKGKFKQKNILDENGEDASYMMNSENIKSCKLPQYNSMDIRGSFLHIEGKIQESIAELHFMLKGKTYRATVKYDISKDFQDEDACKIACHISIEKYQILKGQRNKKWVDEGRLTNDNKKILESLIFDILNDAKYNPHIISE